MDPRVSVVAEAALRRMGGVPRPARGEPLRIEALTLAQLSDLAAPRPDDPLVAGVVEALRAGTPVLLDRARIEAALDLGGYPPRLREQFERWFARIASFGVALVGETAPSPPPPERTDGVPPSLARAPADHPERQVFEAILGTVDPASHPCFLDPGRICQSCSGRCRTLGF